MSYDKVRPGGWHDKPATDTPVDADALNYFEQTFSDHADAIDAAVAQLASAPDAMANGAITRSASGAATSFAVLWPDGATGTFTGTESTVSPGALDSYVVTHVLAGVTTTYAQPTLTRSASGTVTNRPIMTVS